MTTKFIKERPAVLAANGNTRDQEIVEVMDLEEAFDILESIDFDALQAVAKEFYFSNDLDILLDLRTGKKYINKINPWDTVNNTGFLIKTLWALDNRKQRFDIQEIKRRLGEHYNGWSIDNNIGEKNGPTN